MFWIPKNGLMFNNGKIWSPRTTLSMLKSLIPAIDTTQPQQQKNVKKINRVTKDLGNIFTQTWARNGLFGFNMFPKSYTMINDTIRTSLDDPTFPDILKPHDFARSEIVSISALKITEEWEKTFGEPFKDIWTNSDGTTTDKQFMTVNTTANVGSTLYNMKFIDIELKGDKFVRYYYTDTNDTYLEPCDFTGDHIFLTNLFNIMYSICDYRLEGQKKQVKITVPVLNIEPEPVDILSTIKNMIPDIKWKEGLELTVCQSATGLKVTPQGIDVTSGTCSVLERCSPDMEIKLDRPHIMAVYEHGHPIPIIFAQIDFE